MICVLVVMRHLENKFLHMVKINTNDNNFKRTISRLIIGKILSSSSSKWMRNKSYEKLSAEFLSTEPEKDIFISYGLKKSGIDDAAYSSEIASLSIRWVDQNEEIIDPEGNVWKMSYLKIVPSLCSAYSDKEDSFSARVDCLTEVNATVSEIRKMVPGSIKSMILDNAGRIERNSRKIYDENCESIKSVIVAQGLAKNLRKGGKGKTFSRERFPASILNGKYEIIFETGTRRLPVVKKYTVVVPENPSYLVQIQRKI